MLTSKALLVTISWVFLNINGCTINEPGFDSRNSYSSAFLLKGISVVAPVNPVDSFAFQAVKSMNAGSVAIMPYAFCTTGDPVIRYKRKGGWWGENDEGVARCIKLAHDQGMTVMLKPHLWISRGMYTGDFTLINEKDWKAWEDSYRAYILHFANIAESLQAEIFCIGTELGGTIKQRPLFWDSLIDTLRLTYRGKITYAANWDDYKLVPFWSKLDYIGIDAYFPLSSERTPSVTALRKGWKTHVDALEKFNKKVDRPILFTEYGYRNVDYTGKEPWRENKGDRNDEAQANALDAFFQSFSGKKWFMGGYVWKWYIDKPPRERRSIDFTPQDKAGQMVIAKWYNQ